MKWKKDRKPLILLLFVLSLIPLIGGAFLIWEFRELFFYIPATGCFPPDCPARNYFLENLVAFLGCFLFFFFYPLIISVSLLRKLLSKKTNVV